MNNSVRNFGDALYEVLLPDVVFADFAEDTKNLYYPIGSVIANSHMKSALKQGYKPVFINCGWRGEILDPGLVKQSDFLGCRGPFTQKELARHGVEVEVTGDPAYKVPDFVEKGPPNALALLVHHIADSANYNKNAIHELKVDDVISPVIETKDDIVDLITKISGARFVLAGSMHAAIVAHAYGVPFAPFRGQRDYIDCIPKWHDWMAGERIGRPEFCRDVVEGRQWYRSISS